MKHRSLSRLTAVLLGLLLALPTVLSAQIAGWKPQQQSDEVIDRSLYEQARATITTFQERDPDLRSFLDQAHAFVVFPTVGKGGVGIGGAYGKGVLFEGGEAVGEATLSQVTVGFQWGGQAYSEIIFFQAAEHTDRFKRSSFEVAAQVSAVAATVGASRDVSYVGGVAVFTLAKGGLMYEASVGGQKFSFKEKAPPSSE